MEIKLSSTIASVLMFLKKEFNINLGLKKDSISKFRSLPVIKAPTHVNKKLSGKVFFVIDEDTIVFELVNFFQKQGGLSIELRNKNGIKLPDDIMLKQVSDIPSMPSSSRTIEDYLKVTTRLANSGDYYDSDWAVRILESAAFKANNNSEK